MTAIGPKIGIYFLICSLLVVSSIARAEDVDLRLDVEGFIQPSPTWRDENDRIIDHVSFNFSRPSNVAEVHRDVDSDVQKAKLVDTRKGFISVHLRRPQNCSIGNQPISDRDVYFIHNLHVHREDTYIEFFERRLQSFQIRFGGTGGYGHLVGAVKCGQSGNLTYTYD